MARRPGGLGWLAVLALAPLLAAGVTARAAATPPLAALALRPNCGAPGSGVPPTPPPTQAPPSPIPSPSPSPTQVPIQLVIPAPAYSIEVLGRGLPAGAAEVVFDPGPSQQAFPVTVSAAGDLDTSIDVVAVPDGTYAVVLQSVTRGSIAAQALFVVPCPPVRVTPGPGPRGGLVLNPTLALAPAVGPPGTVVVARGADFPPGSVVSLGWNQGIAGSTGAPVVADASGAFRTTVLVFPHDALGVRVLTAVSAPVQNSRLIGFASASFLVVAGEAQPRDFSSRR
jgi:hypothetical protein